MGYTKGDWNIKALERGHEDRIKIASDVTEDGRFELVCFVHGARNREANANLIAQSPRMAEWIAKVAKQGFVTFPEDRKVAKEIIQTLDLS